MQASRVRQGGKTYLQPQRMKIQFLSLSYELSSSGVVEILVGIPSAGLTYKSYLPCLGSALRPRHALSTLHNSLYIVMGIDRLLSHTVQRLIEGMSGFGLRVRTIQGYVAWRLLPSPALASGCSKARDSFVRTGTQLAVSSPCEPELVVHSLPSRAPRGALAFVSLWCVFWVCPQSYGAAQPPSDTFTKSR